jgi:hypothetical protein
MNLIILLIFNCIYISIPYSVDFNVINSDIGSNDINNTPTDNN